MQKLKKFFIIVAIIFILANGSAGGIISQFAVSVGSYLGLCVGSVFSKQIRQDMSDINYNPFNTSEQKVINSTSVSFYKGVPIYRTDGLNRSGSFCAILLAYGDGADDVRHESGHNVQQLILGPISFLAIIGAPSYFELSTQDYYNRPWEITADVFGGVQQRPHTNADIMRGKAYLATAAISGPFAFLFLIGQY